MIQPTFNDLLPSSRQVADRGEALLNLVMHEAAPHYRDGFLLLCHSLNLTAADVCANAGLVGCKTMAELLDYVRSLAEKAPKIEGQKVKLLDAIKEADPDSRKALSQLCRDLDMFPYQLCAAAQKVGCSTVAELVDYAQAAYQRRQPTRLDMVPSPYGRGSVSRAHLIEQGWEESQTGEWTHPDGPVLQDPRKPSNRVLRGVLTRLGWSDDSGTWTHSKYPSGAPGPHGSDYVYCEVLGRCTSCAPGVIAEEWNADVINPPAPHLLLGSVVTEPVRSAALRPDSFEAVRVKRPVEIEIQGFDPTPLPKPKRWLILTIAAALLFLVGLRVGMSIASHVSQEVSNGH